MRDEDFEVFIEEFNEASHHTPVPKEAIEKWKGKLPDQLLTYWKEEGWNGYANGLFWVVNPDEYEDIVDEWLEDSRFEEIDAFHVIARTAFGKLYLFGEKTGASVTINCLTNAIFALAKDLKNKMDDPNFYAQTFFSNKEIKNCDLKDDSGKFLFERALKKLGTLSADEMYGFEPALVLGGKMQLENLVKVKLDQHLTILRQLAAPTMPFSNIDVDKLLNS